MDDHLRDFLAAALEGAGPCVSNTGRSHQQRLRTLSALLGFGMWEKPGERGEFPRLREEAETETTLGALEQPVDERHLRFHLPVRRASFIQKEVLSLREESAAGSVCVCVCAHSLFSLTCWRDEWVHRTLEEVVECQTRGCGAWLPECQC